MLLCTLPFQYGCQPYHVVACHFVVVCPFHWLSEWKRICSCHDTTEMQGRRPSIDMAEAVDNVASNSNSGIEDNSTATLARLEALAASPYRYEVHVANINAAVKTDEKEEARSLMSSMLPLSEELWMEWIEERKRAVAATPSVEASIDVIELYKRACGDYLCKQSSLS